MADIVQIQDSEYDVILRQAVAVIDRARTMVATTICSAIGTAHWEIGKLLHDKKVENKQYHDGDVSEAKLTESLRECRI